MAISISLRTFVVAGVLVIVAGLCAQPALAQGRGNDDKPFSINGHTWVNQKAFIESGARCATRHVDDIEADEIDKAVARHLNEKFAGVAAAVPPRTFNVYFHVIMDGASGVVSELTDHGSSEGTERCLRRHGIQLCAGRHRHHRQCVLVYDDAGLHSGEAG